MYPCFFSQELKTFSFASGLHSHSWGVSVNGSGAGRNLFLDLAANPESGLRSLVSLSDRLSPETIATPDSVVLSDLPSRGFNS